MFNACYLEGGKVYEWRKEIEESVRKLPKSNYRATFQQADQ